MADDDTGLIQFQMKPRHNPEQRRSAAGGGAPPAYMSTMQDSRDQESRGSQPERPRSEPEIIPPARSRAGAEDWYEISGDETFRVHRATFRTPGPLGIIVALLVIGTIAAIVLLLILGAVLVWIPVAALAIAALVLAGTVRRYWRRLRGR